MTIAEDRIPCLISRRSAFTGLGVLSVRREGKVDLPLPAFDIKPHPWQGESQK